MARGGHDREQRQDEAERHARQLTALAVTMIVIPTAAVALRFWSRLTRGGKSADGTRPLRIGLWWDDWAALLSLVGG
jgi:nicotinamide riboside transporter PnuC